MSDKLKQVDTFRSMVGDGMPATLIAQMPSGTNKGMPPTLIAPLPAAESGSPAPPASSPSTSAPAALSGEVVTSDGHGCDDAP